tara:strand:- start:3373 stop:3879 length:507 start_codon:yes stop_codon:yes gene_type:complete
MAQDRKIQFSTQVIPKIESGLEEYTGSRYNKLHTSVNKKLGGNGYIDINATQADDKWTSFPSAGTNWDNDLNQWEAITDTWDLGDIPISSSLIQLTSNSNTMAFCYIKNTGENTVKVTVEYGAGSPTFPIKVKGGASVQFRGNGLNTNKIGVIRDSSDSTIEYVIAKT